MRTTRVSMFTLSTNSSERTKKSTDYLSEPIRHLANYPGHYEAKLCFLCIACGFHDRPKADLPRNPHHTYFSLIVFAVMVSANKNLKHCSAQNRSKNRRIYGIRNRICGIQNSLCSPQTNNKTCV